MNIIRKPRRNHLLKLYVDGASLGNPGAAGIGVVLCTETGEPVKEISEAIGISTNNVAEYRALIRGLEEAQAAGADCVEVFTDSELVVRQLSGQYGVYAPHLIPLHQQALHLLRAFRAASIRHIRGVHNTQANRLAQKAAQSARRMLQMQQGCNGHTLSL